MSGGGGNDNGQGGQYNASQTGALFGTKLRDYLTNPAPVYGQGLYTGMHGMEREGLDRMRNEALGAVGDLRGGFNQTSDISRMGGMTNPMRDAMGDMGSLANQYGNIAGGLRGPSGAQTDYEGIGDSLRGPSGAQTGFGDIADSLGGRSFAESGYRGLYGEGGGPSLTEQRLGDAKYGQDSDAYQTLRSKLADDVTTQNLAAFNSSGMFGSDDNRSSLAEGLGTAMAGMDLDQQRYGDQLQRQDLASIEGLRQQDYQNRFNSLGAGDQARLQQLNARMGALSAEDQARLAQINTRMGAIGAGDQSRLAQLQAQMGALGAQQGATSDRFQMGNTGVQNTLAAGDRLGQRYRDMMMPGQTIADIGSRYGEDRQAQRLDDFDRFNRTKNADYDRFRELFGIMSNSQNLPGMEEKVPFWQQMLGYMGQNVGNAARAAGGM